MVQLGVQHLVGNAFALARLGVNIEVEHAGEQLRDFHRRCTYQRGASRLAHLHHFLDDGPILLALSLVDAVVHIIADDGAVGGNLHHVELIDVPELACLGRGSTRHTGQFVVHAEVVLQGDGGKGLCGGLHLYMLLGFYGLMQSVAPASAFHDAARLLVHNLHLAVDDHVLVVLVEHAVGLEQLLQGVYALRLYGIVRHEFVLLVHALLVAQSRLHFESRQLAGDVGQHKQLGIVHFIGQPACTLVGQVARVQFLVYHEEEGCYALGHAAVIVLHVYLLGLQHACLDTFLREILDEGLVLGQGLVRTVEREEACVEQFLSLFLVAAFH